jgi:hypothetical protein
MIVLHGVVLVLLCMIILLNITLPPSIRSIGIVPVTITLMFMVMYLFTHSPLLGIVGIVAAYTLIQSSTTRSIPALPTDADFTPTNQFQETLEEYMVNRIVPMVQSTPTHLNFKYATENTHNASSIH